jgi:hypothetical protein
MSAKLNAKQPAQTMEAADAEIDALLAKIPDKYRTAAAAKKHPPRNRGASWKCEPLTLLISFILVLGITVLMFLSMSPKPFWAFQELHGNWMAEPQSAAARRVAADALDEDFSIHCAAPDVVRSLKASDILAAEQDSDNSAIEESDKIVGTLPEAACTFTFGPFRVAASRMVFYSVKANSAVWTWTGSCVDGGAAICTVMIHRKHTIFVVHDENTSAVFSYLLTRWDTRRLGGSDGLMGFWKEKGRFIVLIVSLIVGLKFLQHLLSSKEDVGKKLREQRFRKALEQRQKALRGDRAAL